MSDKEVNLPDYINFVYNRFLMTRVEYLIFTQSEQESKILRIIEWCIEIERGHLYRALKAKVTPGEKVELPEIIWVAISHRFFMDQLQGTVQSETTLKDVLASLEAKHFIFRGPSGPGPYDAPIYTINKHLLAALSSLLPPTLDELDMIAIMKKEREVKKVREGQKLTPSIIDPLVLKIRETIIDPLDPQLLTLYAPKIDPLLRSRGGQKLPPRIYKETTKEESKESNMSSSDDASSLQTEKEKSLEKEVALLKAQIAQILQTTDKTPSYPPEPQGGVTPTLAGQFASSEQAMAVYHEMEPNYAEANKALASGTQETPADHTAILEPPCSTTDSRTQETYSVDHPETNTPEIATEGQQTLSSIQAVDESNRQATEQEVSNGSSNHTTDHHGSLMDSGRSDLSAVEAPEQQVQSIKQASGDDLIATGATKKPRGSRGKSAAGKEEKPAKPKKEITGSQEALEIVDMYISLFKHPIPLTQSMVDEAEKLVPCHPTREDLNDVRLWCYTSNPDWYGKNGKTKGRVTMKTIVDNWAGWVASQEAPSTGFQIPDELKDRVASVYAALNEWRATKTGDSENVFVPDAEGDQAICNLLQKGRRPTKKRMNILCDALWETPRNSKSGYLLREHMTVKAICLAYRERELELVAKEQEAQEPKNIVDLFDANRTFGNGLKYLPGALPVAKPVVMEG